MKLHTRTDKGHELLRITPEHHDGRATRYVSVHRLAAVAWGLLDGMDDPREVHHITEVGWLNAESNLEALPPQEHARRTRRREYERRQEATA